MLDTLYNISFIKISRGHIPETLLEQLTVYSPVYFLGNLLNIT